MTSSKGKKENMRETNHFMMMLVNVYGKNMHLETEEASQIVLRFFHIFTV